MVPFFPSVVEEDVQEETERKQTEHQAGFIGNLRNEAVSWQYICKRYNMESWKTEISAVQVKKRRTDEKDNLLSDINVKLPESAQHPTITRHASCHMRMIGDDGSTCGRDGFSQSTPPFTTSIVHPFPAQGQTRLREQYTPSGSWPPSPIQNRYVFTNKTSQSACLTHNEAAEKTMIYSQVRKFKHSGLYGK